MTIDLNDNLKVVAKMQYQGISAIQNAYCVKVTDVASATQLQIRESVARYIEDIYGNFDSLLPDDITFETISIFNISNQLPEPDIGWPTLVDGDGSTDPLPEFACVFAYCSTTTPKVYGRKYWPPPTEVNATGSVLNSGTITAYTGALADWIDVYTDPTTSVELTPLIARFSEEPIAYAVPATAQLVTRLAVQRRRKVGVGE